MTPDTAQKPKWKAEPKAGTVWHRRAYYTFFRHGAETRHVIDRTLGCDVIYVSGRWSRFAHKSQCTLAEWKEWAAAGYGAKKVSP